MSKKTDSQTIKREKSPVAEMYIWQESVKKETQCQKVYENFTINPSKLYILQEKPNNNIMLIKQLKKTGASSTLFNEFDQQQTESEPLQRLQQSQYDYIIDELQDKLQSITKTPKEKYQYPQTSSQELGWHQQEALNSPQKSKFTYPRKLCKETQYANDYFTMNKISPYSNKFK